jgi:hypothetical protein
VEPYHLVAYHGNWYLLAWNTLCARMETFALSRCRSIAGTGEHFAPPVGFDARRFFLDAFGISQAQEPWKVRLLFDKEVATYNPRTSVACQPAIAWPLGRRGGTAPPNLQPQRTDPVDPAQSCQSTPHIRHRI